MKKPAAAQLDDVGAVVVAGRPAVGVRDAAGPEPAAADGHRRRADDQARPVGQKEAARILAAARVPVEHGFAHVRNTSTVKRSHADSVRP